ncbi:ADP-ribosylglycohydrolase family protein [Nocardia rhamnosiphila]
MREYEILVDRIRGTLVGGAVGDALGRPIEFLSLDNIRARYGPDGVTGFLPGPDQESPQAITDDTQMTLYTAEGLLRCPPGGDPAPSLRRAYSSLAAHAAGAGPGEQCRTVGWPDCRSSTRSARRATPV